jgi:hypothetical protein
MHVAVDRRVAQLVILQARFVVLNEIRPNRSERKDRPTPRGQRPTQPIASLNPP